MTVIAEFWVSLGAGGQAALIGIAISGAGFAVTRLFPDWQFLPNRAKRVLIALGAGLSAFAMTANWGAAIAAALSAFGTYQLVTGRR